MTGLEEVTPGGNVRWSVPVVGQSLAVGTGVAATPGGSLCVVNLADHHVRHIPLSTSFWFSMDVVGDTRWWSFATRAATATSRSFRMGCS